MKIKTITLLVIAALTIILVMQNAQPVSLQVYFWNFEVSGLYVYPVVLLIGIVLGIVIIKINDHKKKKHAETDSKENK